MKKRALIASLIAFTIAIMSASCTEKEPHGGNENNVFVNVSGIEGDMNVKSSVYETINIRAITLVFFDAQNHKVHDSTQLKANFTGDDLAKFGKFSCLLPQGTYTMIVLGYDNISPATVSSINVATFADPAKMVYQAQQTVIVEKSGRLSLPLVLNRITAQFRINARETKIPVGIKHLRYTFSKSGTTLNPTTALATTDNGFEVLSQDYQSLWDDPERTLIFSRDILLYTDEETMNIRVEALDTANHVVVYHEFPNVPLKRNRRTTITGAIFHAEFDTNFSVNTDWLDEYDMGSF